MTFLFPAAAAATKQWAERLPWSPSRRTTRWWATCRQHLTSRTSSKRRRRRKTWWRLVRRIRNRSPWPTRWTTTTRSHTKSLKKSSTFSRNWRKQTGQNFLKLYSDVQTSSVRLKFIFLSIWVKMAPNTPGYSATPRLGSVKQSISVICRIRSLCVHQHHQWPRNYGSSFALWRSPQCWTWHHGMIVKWLAIPTSLLRL